MFVDSFACTPAEVRTLDTLIKSQVLYQLSYGCIVFLFSGCIFFLPTNFETTFFPDDNIFENVV